MIGEGAGAGYNINVPWENGRCGDADYFAVWDHILLPLAKLPSRHALILRWNQGYILLLKSVQSYLQQNSSTEK